MRKHQRVDALIRSAEDLQCCAHIVLPADNAAANRRVATGELLRPYPAMFARAEYWNGLNPRERSLHVARSLSAVHQDWVFAGLTAAAAHGLEYLWNLHDGRVTILEYGRGDYASGSLNHIYASRSITGVSQADGIPVTDLARTVVDCALAFEFRFALAIADSALARGVSVEEILPVCATLHRDCSKVFRVLRYADPRSENGGESLARGTMTDGGLQIPELQMEFVDPQTGRTYRADFVWYLPDGRIIVGEFDGKAKYVDPSMTGGKSVSSVVEDERERQEGMKRAGVSALFRFTFRDALNRTPLLMKAANCGVPYRRG